MTYCIKTSLQFALSANYTTTVPNTTYIHPSAPSRQSQQRLFFLGESLNTDARLNTFANILCSYISQKNAPILTPKLAEYAIQYAARLSQAQGNSLRFAFLYHNTDQSFTIAHWGDCEICQFRKGELLFKNTNDGSISIHTISDIQPNDYWLLFSATVYERLLLRELRQLLAHPAPTESTDRAALYKIRDAMAGTSAAFILLPISPIITHSIPYSAQNTTAPNPTATHVTPPQTIIPSAKNSFSWANFSLAFLVFVLISYAFQYRYTHLSPEKQSHRYATEAWEALAERRYADATEYFNNALYFSPYLDNEQKCLLYEGRQTAKISATLQYSEQALQEQDHATARKLLGQILVLEPHHAVAQQKLADLQQLAKQQSQVIVAHADSLFHTASFEQAKQRYYEALTLEPQQPRIWAYIQACNHYLPAYDELDSETSCLSIAE